MRLNFDWFRWLVVTAFAMLVLSMMCRCTTTKYVPMVQYKEKIVSKTDTLVQNDSVWVHDSVMITQRGDTIFHDRWHYKDRYKYIYKNSADTLVLHDSIPYKVEVEKPPSKLQTMYIDLGKIAVAILVILILVAIMAWLINRKK